MSFALRKPPLHGLQLNMPPSKTITVTHNFYVRKKRFLDRSTAPHKTTLSLLTHTHTPQLFQLEQLTLLTEEDHSTMLQYFDQVAPEGQAPYTDFYALGKELILRLYRNQDTSEVHVKSQLRTLLKRGHLSNEDTFHPQEELLHAY